MQDILKNASLQVLSFKESRCLMLRLVKSRALITSGKAPHKDTNNPCLQGKLVVEDPVLSRCSLTPTFAAQRAQRATT